MRLASAFAAAFVVASICTAIHAALLGHVQPGAAGRIPVAAEHPVDAIQPASAPALGPALTLLETVKAFREDFGTLAERLGDLADAARSEYTPQKAHDELTALLTECQATLDALKNFRLRYRLGEEEARLYAEALRFGEKLRDDLTRLLQPRRPAIRPAPRQLARGFFTPSRAS